MKTWKVSFYREGKCSAWAYARFSARNLEAVIARINRELKHLNRLTDSTGKWVVSQIKEEGSL